MKRCNLGVVHWVEAYKDTPVARILMAISAERAKQDGKWGEQNHLNLYWLGILGEEFGEVAKALIEDDPTDHVREELVQVAAVCVAWLECLHRREAVVA